MVTKDLHDIPQLQPVKVIAFKICPKCGGNLGIESDCYGKYLSCIQCGYEKDIK
jgi:hypothetical protein